MNVVVIVCLYIMNLYVINLISHDSRVLRYMNVA